MLNMFDVLLATTRHGPLISIWHHLPKKWWQNFQNYPSRDVKISMSNSTWNFDNKNSDVVLDILTTFLWQNSEVAPPISVKIWKYWHQNSGKYENSNEILGGIERDCENLETFLVSLDLPIQHVESFCYLTGSF